ncbi:hypothetical protein B0F86_20805 [Pseudomonas syringae]|uniref:hypothetical protein n=1 Tax=Pseudomonas syringae TaxID=317 RepID=UPI000CEE59B4|nr:hypothetical protein [Pseudomonas syringae]PPS38753.1 hypothetical protein B0F86_20805 [Pseudomonas syringae]
MEKDNEANHIKWLLNELIVDLAAAVTMGREVLELHDGSPESTLKAMGRLRVCNHSIMLSLFKLHEIRVKYSKFLSTLPKDQTKSFIKITAEIQQKGICNFRNKYAAHIIDKDTQRPISMAKGLELLKCITGNNNSQAHEFYDWVCPEEWSVDKPCIVTTVHNLRAYCKEMPGGDLERP